MTKGVAPLRDKVALLFIAALLLDSFGFNNIPLGPAPAALVIAALLSATYAYTELHWIRSRPAFPVLAFCYVLVTGMALVRLPADFGTYGMDALRDSLFLLDVGGVFVGVGLARRRREIGLDRAISWILVACLAWFSLTPFAQIIIDASPLVGVQRPEPLASFYSAGYVSVLGFAWFAPRRGVAPAAAALAFLAIAIIGQFKSSILAIALLLLATVSLWSLQRFDWGRRRTNAASYMRIPIILAVAGMIAVALSVAGVQAPGRLDSATPLEVVGRILDAGSPDTPGSESIDYRKQWQGYAAGRLMSDGRSVLTGSGLGADLTGGFRSSSDAAVRSPHNDFLEVATRLGLLAGVAWATMTIFLPLTLLARLKNGAYVSAGLGFLVAWWTFAATQSFFSFTYGGFPFWVVVGLLMGVVAPVTPSRGHPARATSAPVSVS